jgi:hypothetical protein
MGTFFFFHPLTEVDLPPKVNDFHPEIEVTLDQEAFIFALVRSPHFFFLVVLWVWCMNFYEIVLFQMILQMASTSFSMCVGTLLEVMFHF